jgi:hypothetical protein
MAGLHGTYLAYSTVAGHDTLHGISAISGVGAVVRKGTPSGTGWWVQPWRGGWEGAVGGVRAVLAVLAVLAGSGCGRWGSAATGVSVRRSCVSRAGCADGRVRRGGRD